MEPFLTPSNDDHYWSMTGVRGLFKRTVRRLRMESILLFGTRGQKKKSSHTVVLTVAILLSKFYSFVS